MKIKIYTYSTVSKINKQRNLILPEISIIIIRLTNLKFHLSQLKLAYTPSTKPLYNTANFVLLQKSGGDYSPISRDKAY